MKQKWIILPVFILLTQVVSAQFPADCQASETVKNHYLSSAKVLALRQMLGDPQWADSVLIPESLYKPFLNGLVAVYKAYGLPERDTVVECLDIQAYFAPYVLDRISLFVDTTETWAKNLHQGIFPTGNATVDQLMYQYELKKLSSYKFSKYHISLESASLLNTVALAKLFDALPNTDADADAGIGEGEDITVDTVGASIQLTYKTGWGDCPAGCIFHRWWTFSVAPDCSAKFIKVQGDQLTQEVSCNKNYDCYSDPLCLPWLQDSLERYAGQFPQCSQNTPELRLTLIEQYLSYPVLAVSVDQGFDAGFTDFYYCDGSKIGTCQLTIVGPICSPAYLINYPLGEELWNCLSPVPDPGNCTTGTPPEPGNELSMTIYPNPSMDGTLMVSMDPGDKGNGIITVYDAAGRAILTQKINNVGNVEPLNLKGSNPPPGIYWIKVKTQKGATIKKWVVARR